MVVGGLLYHITQRGNYGQRVSDDDDDELTLRELRNAARTGRPAGGE